MGEHNMRIQELRKDLDGLRGSFEGISGNMEELRKTVDEKLVASMEEFRRILMATVGNQIPLGEEVPIRQGARRSGDEELPIKGHQLEFPKFDGVGLSDWLYQCEQYFEVAETPATSRVKMASCRLEGKALQWHQ
ncbi:hypothetical protein A4A49_65195, partial [Nicotiana attenuata]